MRKPPINWNRWKPLFVGIGAVCAALVIIFLISLLVNSCRNCEIQTEQYGEITKWAEGGWTGAYPELKEAIAEANSDGKISNCEFDDLQALRDRCGYEDARSHMMRTIENPPEKDD